MGAVLTEVALCGEVRARTLLAPLPNGLATQLFAYLVLHRRRPLQHAALADALWPNDRPRDPRAVLSSLLSRLRRSLGPQALPLGAAVRLELPPGATVDVEEASGALVAARAALERREPEVAWERAEQAREIAGRGLLAGFDARWIDPWRTDVESTHLDALELLARSGALLGGERARAGERAARRAISRAPLRESAHAALMEALGALAEPAAALQVYEELRRALDAELGTVPSQGVRDLHQRLLGSAGPQPLSPSFAPRKEEPRSTAARLHGLGPDGELLVQRVAALGEVASVELLVRLAELGEGAARAEVLRALQRASDAGLLAPAASWLGPAVGFAHPPDGEAVLAAMPLTVPSTIAADALALLEREDGDGVAIARLALRAVPALARDEAVRRARAGIALLLRGRAFEQAAALAQQTLAVGPARRDRVELLLELGRALRRDDPDRAWRAAVSACEAARELDDPALQARAALAAGASGPGADAAHADAGLARRLRDALARLDAACDAPDDSPAGDAFAAAAGTLRSQLLARLALDRSWSDPEEAQALAAQAAELAGLAPAPAIATAARDAAPAPAAATARDLPLRHAARIALAQLAARRDPAATPDRLALVDGLVARARAEGDRAVEAAALLQRLPLLGELGRALAAADDLDRLGQLAEALGDRRIHRVVTDVATVRELIAGRPLPPRPQRPGWCEVRVAMAQGGLAPLLGEVDDLVRLQPALAGPRALSAFVRLLAGDVQEAERRLARWQPHELASSGRTEGHQLHLWSVLGLVAARTGAREHAEALHALLEPFADRHAVAPATAYLTPVARVLGELDGALGRPGACEQRLREAVAAAEAFGAAAVADAMSRELGLYAPPSRDRR
jgi:DNA-binding SARP family transcriptional activator